MQTFCAWSIYRFLIKRKCSICCVMAYCYDAVAVDLGVIWPGFGTLPALGLINGGLREANVLAEMKAAHITCDNWFRGTVCNDNTRYYQISFFVCSSFGAWGRNLLVTSTFLLHSSFKTPYSKLYHIHITTISSLLVAPACSLYLCCTNNKPLCRELFVSPPHAGGKIQPSINEKTLQ